MTHINHKWVSLNHLAFELVRRIPGTKIKSVYVIVDICDNEGCKAGRTANNEVFENVSPGIQHLEGQQVFTGKLEIR